MPREDHAPSNGGKHLGPIVFISEENLINIWHQGVPRFVKKICDMYGSFIWALFPLKLEFQIEGKVGNGLPKSAKDMLEFRPILVAKSKINTTKVISDTIRRSFGPKLDVPLWQPGINKRDLFFIVGPSTWHTTRIRLDFLRFSEGNRGENEEPRSKRLENTNKSIRKIDIATLISYLKFLI